MQLNIFLVLSFSGLKIVWFVFCFDVWFRIIWYTYQKINLPVDLHFNAHSSFMYQDVNTNINCFIYNNFFSNREKYVVCAIINKMKRCWFCKISQHLLPVLIFNKACVIYQFDQHWSRLVDDNTSPKFRNHRH